MLLDTLMVKITGDASGLSSATSKAEAEIRGLEGATDETANGMSASVVAKGVIIGNMISSVATQAISAVGNATQAVVGGAVEQYAAYEQNVGGIQKLFGNMGQSLEEYAASNGTTTDAIASQWQSLENAQNTVLKNAQNAWQTAGMSANTYMENATQISAALINSLGGDTEKAASQVDVAMRAISDNVNTFGTNMEDVTNAFKGFAKENYTMLDNLSLGYGGTKEEMERLIQDANEYAATIGETSDLSIDSFSDIVTAIELIQEKTNIAGTTTREASSTIEGSVNAAKAAWDNWLTALGDGTQDMSAYTENLVSAVGTAAKNIVPRIASIVGSLVPVIAQAIATSGSEIIESGAEIANQAIEGFTSALYGSDDIDSAVSSTFDVADKIGEAFGLSAEQIQPTLDSISNAFMSVRDMLVSVGTTIQPYIEPFVSALQEMGNTISANVLPMVMSMVSYASQLASTLSAVLTPVLNTLLPIILQIGTMVIQHITNIAATVMPTITSIYNLLTEVMAVIQPIVVSAMTTIMGIVQTVWPSIQNTIQGVLNTIQAVISTVMGVIQGIIQVVLGVIHGDWSQVMNGLQQIASSIWNGIQSIISGVIQTVSGIISTYLSVIQGVWNAAWNTIGSVLSGAWNSIKSGVKSGISAVVSFMSGLPGKIVNALGNVGNLLVNAGKSIMSGLLRGLKNAFKNVTSFVGGIADTIASLKGPIPYDLKLLIPNGQAIMQSLLTGINNGVTDVFDRVSNIGGEIADSLSGDYTIPVTPELQVGQFGTLGLVGAGAAQIQYPTATETTNVYINGAKVNDDDDMRSITRDFLLELKRKADL